MSHAPIIKDIKTMGAFSELLNHNPGIIILKFGADWCGPCKMIEPCVNQWFAKMPAHQVLCGLIDVDDNFEVYGFLKNKRVLRGIPAMLCYYKGNTHYIPNDMTTGADRRATDDFFERCLDQLH
jgi:thiol-disulfide isomerase/thioredoxin